MSSFKTKDPEPEEGMLTEGGGTSPTVEQIKSFLTPIIGPAITLAAGLAAALLAQNFPGINLPQNTIAGIFLTAIAAAAAIIIKRMHSEDIRFNGWLSREAEHARLTARAEQFVAPLASEIGQIMPPGYDDLKDDVAKLKDLFDRLMTQTDDWPGRLEIEKMIEARFGRLEEALPKAAQEAIKAINLGDLFAARAALADPEPVSGPTAHAPDSEPSTRVDEPAVPSSVVSPPAAVASPHVPPAQVVPGRPAEPRP